MSGKSNPFRILLADPPLIFDKLETNYPNVGILYLISYVRKHLENIQIKYLPASNDVNHFLTELQNFNPNVLGLSFTSIGTKNAYASIAAVKERFPELPIICGGAHPTILPDEVLTKTAADMCILGEGEITFIETVRYFQGELDRHDIQGLVWRENGKINRSSNRQPIRDLDQIPFPAWDLVGLYDFIGPQVRHNEPVSVVLTSRGCPYYCVFCSNPIWKLEKPHYRARSPENVADEIKLLYDKGFREIYIRSDEFNADTKWAIDVCKAIKNLNLTDLSFQCNLRADRMNDELADLLADIGCWLVHLGIESANDRVLKGIKKFITVNQIESICETLKMRGIKVFGFFMMFQAWEENGQPVFETREEVNNSLKFAWRMVRKGLIHYMSWQIATPVPGAELYNISLKHNLIKPDSTVEGMWESIINIPGLDEKTVKRIRLKGMLLQSYLYLKSGNIQWRHWGKIAKKLKYMIRSV